MALEIAVLDQLPHVEPQLAAAHPGLLLERLHPFECAVSLLSSSLANAPRLARRVYRPEDGALVVEDVTPERFDELARGTLAALARSG